MATEDKDFQNRLLSMLKSKKFVDYEIVCEGETIPVHKVIFCAASPVFDTACSMQFKPTTYWQQEANGTYHMDDSPLWAVRCMVEYMYSGDYDEKRHSQGDVGKATELHVTMSVLGDRYLIPGLERQASIKFRKMLYGRNMDVTAFIRSARCVYNSTPHTVADFRDTVVKLAIVKHRRQLLSKEVKPLYDSLISDCPDFASDLLASCLSDSVEVPTSWLYSDSEDD
ncbi:hypothetical protein E4U53_000658 [Claviceps sorghi]|nr:hypothetical protein E4U53_000658 [Claviceps sorghi]